MANKKKKEVETPQDPLADVFGLDKSAYKQKTEKEYETYIRSLSVSELDRHANSVGVIPSPRASREILIDRLKKKFVFGRVSLPVKDSEKEEIAMLDPKDEEELKRYFQRRQFYKNPCFWCKFNTNCKIKEQGL